MIANAAAAQASWWQLILMGIIVFGLFMFLFGTALEIFHGVCRFLVKLFSPKTYYYIYMDTRMAWEDSVIEHKDPTRPRSWEDEASARIYVADRMRQLMK